MHIKTQASEFSLLSTLFIPKTNTKTPIYVGGGGGGGGGELMIIELFTADLLTGSFLQYKINAWSATEGEGVNTRGQLGQT